MSATNLDLCDVTGGELTMTGQTTIGSDDQAAARMRAACYFIVEHLPNSGLAEARDALQDIFDFWRQESVFYEPQVVATSAARIVGTQERPDLLIDFDE